MEYIEYNQYTNRTPYQPPYPHPNGLIGNEFTDRLLTEQINAGDDVDGWKQRIADIHFERLPDSTKKISTRSEKRAARQRCYLPIGVPQSVKDYAKQVAALDPSLWVSDHDDIAYKDLWWDCQGGHCRNSQGVTGKPYIRFLPPDE